MNNREFTAPYEYREYPKWITLADGSQLIAENAEEEAVLTAPSEDKSALLDQARALGLDPHANTGVEKLKQLISETQSQGVQS
jgi:hypothetical protein